VGPLLEPVPTTTEAAHAQAAQLRERYGVVTRETVLAEGVVGGYASVYPVLKVLEERGRTRRGYFVAGLGAAQFALPGAVDRLRAERDDRLGAERDDDPDPVVLAATDPAQPYGAALAWPETPGRPARTATALAILHRGELVGWFDRASHHLVTFPASAPDHRWADALATMVRTGRAASVEVRKVNGEPVTAEISAVLQGRGFAEGYRGPVLRPEGARRR
jgi:ATP-dependent Lhr-like helicase